jgi:hypothetical protein
VGVAAGAVAAVGLAAWLMPADGWVLDTPQALIVNSGPVSVWGDSSLAMVRVNPEQTEAIVSIKRLDGVIERRLTLQDGGDGVKHFRLDDGQTGVRSDLSFNPQTREYFFQETGSRAGQAYSVRAHGWLTAVCGK